MNGIPPNSSLPVAEKSIVAVGPEAVDGKPDCVKQANHGHAALVVINGILIQKWVTSSNGDCTNAISPSRTAGAEKVTYSVHVSWKKRSRGLYIMQTRRLDF